MKIPFSCPHCGHFTEVEPRYAGQSGKCGDCQKSITIPTLEESQHQANDRQQPRTHHTSVASTNSSAKTRMSRWPKKSAWPLVLYGLAAIVGAALTLWLIISAASRSQSNKSQLPVAARGAPAQCTDNLRKIGAGLEAYYQQHGHFPASNFNAQPDQPAHSWRVEILPFLGENKLFEALEPSEPWDGSRNAQFESGRPAVYAAIDDEILADVETSYFALTGNNMAMAKTVGRRKDEFTDGLDQTIMLIEARGMAVSWMSPEDISAQGANWSINTRSAGFGSQHKLGGTHVLLANGEVRWLDDSIPPEVLLAMCTINGGETVDIDRWLKK